MQHTFLLTSQTWQATGVYYDEQENCFPLTGISHVRRQEGVWTIEGWLEVAVSPPQRFTNAYEIFASAHPGLYPWRSYNPALGVLAGSMLIVGGYILSQYRSADGRYSGGETLLQRDDLTYENVGVAWRQGEKLSSWTATLRAQAQ